LQVSQSRLAFNAAKCMGVSENVFVFRLTISALNTAYRQIFLISHNVIGIFFTNFCPF
jgi:hypothetical protein